MGLMDILGQVVSGGQISDPHFDQMAQSVPSQVLAKGLGGAFASDQTPPIGQMVGQLFGNSSGTQQAGMLNQLIAMIGPLAAAGLANGALGRIMTPNTTLVTPGQAAQLSPQDVQQIVQQAHEAHPGVADGLAGFYAQHAGLIKTLGGAALAIALAQMKNHMSQA